MNIPPPTNKSTLKRLGSLAVIAVCTLAAALALLPFGVSTMSMGSVFCGVIVYRLLQMHRTHPLFRFLTEYHRQTTLSPQQKASMKDGPRMEAHFRRLELMSQARNRITLQGKEVPMRATLDACYAFLGIAPTNLQEIILVDQALKAFKSLDREGLAIIAEHGSIRIESYFEEFGSHRHSASHATFADFLRSYMPGEISWTLTQTLAVKMEQESRYMPASNGLRPAQYYTSLKEAHDLALPPQLEKLEAFLGSAEMAGFAAQIDG